MGAPFGWVGAGAWHSGSLRVVDVTPRGLVAFARSDDGRKWIKYSAVSIIGMTTSQVCIIILYRGFGVPKLLTNFLAVAISSIPAYLLNRAWVWGKHGKNHFTKEVVPFWAFSFAGLVFSLLMVAWIAPDKAAGETATAMDTFRVMVGNVGGFGILWIAKFFVLDRLLFTHDEDDEEEDASDVNGNASSVRVEGPAAERG